MADRLSNYPYVVVRIGCAICPRRGQYRLARLAAKFGPELLLEELLDRIAISCPHSRPLSGRRKRKYEVWCGIELIDIGRPAPRPPDMPGQLVLVQGGLSEPKPKKKAAGAD